jgi:uncharacterized membrane protein YGL010W
MWKCLRAQHLLDMKVYRSAHGEWRNILLHKVLVPVECWSALLFLYIMSDIPGQIPDINGSLRKSLVLLPRAMTSLLGVMSMVLATNRLVGIATLLFHFFAMYSCEFLLIAYSTNTWFLIMFGVTAWTIAWILQVGVGHFGFEGNSPNVAKMQEVSYLAMCQSVLIAWSV